MQIGNFKLKNNVFLAPLAGVSDLVMREICAGYGCGFSYTEMVSAKALSFNDKKSFDLLKMGNVISGIQLFGSDPLIMSESAKKVEGLTPVIDINMGCPVNKVVSNGEGSALMKNIPLACEIVEKTVNAVSVPVTVKMRLGWDKDSFCAVQFAKAMEKSGASAITVHGRFREDFFSGEVNLSAIKKVKESVNIPVIGNGNIFNSEDALKMFDYCGVDAIMIGRGALGNPWIFSDIENALSGKKPAEITKEKRIESAILHAKLLCEYKGMHLGILESRKHVSWYIKGLPGASKTREEVNRATTFDEMEKILRNLL